jgi:hypothetical protein
MAAAGGGGRRNRVDAQLIRDVPQNFNVSVYHE